MSDFIGRLKRRAYLDLIRRWRGGAARRVLKTDLFEEAFGPDAFLSDLAADAETQTAVGMDLSIGIARRARLKAGGKPFSCVVGDVRRLPFAAGSFDLVVSPSTLDHFPDTTDLHTSLVELGAATASDGRLIVTLDNRQNILDPLLRLVIRLGLVPYYVGRSYRIGELVEALEKAGLQVLDRGALVHNPRMLAAASVALTNLRLFAWLRPSIERLLAAMQRLDSTRWRYYSGCFVAAVARRPRGMTGDGAAAASHSVDGPGLR